MKTNIRFKALKIDNISNSSGVFSGDNLQVKWKAFIETNEGSGGLSGNYNKLNNPKSIVIKSATKK